MKVKYLLIAICAAFVMTSCAKQRPQWIDGSSEDYSEPRYFIGVGAVSMDKGGQNQQLNWAGDRARAEISKTVRSQIASTTTAYRRVATDDASRTAQSEQTDIVTAQTNEILEGVQIKSYYRDKKSRMLYALAVLDRPKAASKLKNEVDDIKRSMLTEMDEGAGYQEQNEILLSIRHYNRALHMAQEINSKNELISVLDPAMFVQGDVKNHVAELNKILYGLKKKIRFTVSVAGPASKVRTYIIRGLSQGGFLIKGTDTAGAVKTYVLEGDTDLTRRGDLKWDKDFVVQIYQADLDIEVKNPENNETLGAITWSVSANEKSSEMASKSAVRALGRTVENDIVQKILDLF